MVMRPFFWLMLLGMSGIRCDREFLIFPEKTEFGNKHYFDVKFQYDYYVHHLAVTCPLIPARSSFYCIERHKYFTISYEVPKDYQKQMSFYTTINSGNYRKYDKKQNSSYIEVKLPFYDENLCFLTGTWWPFGEENVEFYIDFLSNKQSTDGVDLIFVKSIVLEKQIKTRLMVKDKSDFNKLKTSEEIEKQKLTAKATNPRYKETLAIISECDKSSHKVIGNIYSSNNGLEVEFNLGRLLMKHTGVGELNMAFISGKKIEPEDAVAAIDKFANEGSKETIETAWAKVTCTNNVVNFSLLNQNLRLLSDGTGKSGFSMNNPLLAI